MAIDLRRLPQEVQDTIELKEATDMTFSRFIDYDYTEIFFGTLAERSDPKSEHSVIVSTWGRQGAGKSLANISLCCYMDPEFSLDKIFFGYDQLVYKRHLLKPHSAVLIDEQSEVFGLDSNRINVVLSNLKEQLRKKAISFFFCAPVLYPEHHSSMYLLEVMFIDYETQECYAALKTREGLTLGHVRIPHPLKVLPELGGRSLASKELLKAYQEKKDEHLETVLNQKNIDVFEERAAEVMKHPTFKQAEKVYKKGMGYIPRNALIQLINKIFPEYRAGVMPIEIADRIKVNKEISGAWDISGRTHKSVSRQQRAGK